MKIFYFSTSNFSCFVPTHLWLHSDREWIGKAIAAVLLSAVVHLLWARWRKIGSKHEKIIICTASDKPAMESIVSAQQGLRTLHEVMQYTNIAILKLWSIITSRSPKVLTQYL